MYEKEKGRDPPICKIGVDGTGEGSHTHKKLKKIKKNGALKLGKDKVVSAASHDFMKVAPVEWGGSMFLHPAPHFYNYSPFSFFSSKY